MKRIIVFFLSICLVIPNIYTVNAKEDVIANEETEDFTLGELGGYLYSFAKSSTKLFDERRFLRPGGNGFAAENANTLYEGFKGINTKVVGGDNAPNGADRIIINKDLSITQIQDKYFKTASESVGDAFENGKYRYMDSQGNPMLLEVPKDQYEKAVELMAKRIEKGQVRGVTDPSEAANIVKKGPLTYEQSVNITKYGKIDSLVYDAVNGCVVAKNAMGITFTLDFVINTINGESLEDSLKSATLSSIKAGAFTGLIYIASSQLIKKGAPSIFVPAASGLTNLLGEQARQILMDLYGGGQKATAGAVQTLLEQQMLVQAVTLVVLSVPDVIDLFNGRISASQLAINLGTIFGGVAGIQVGSVAGGALGSLAVPGAGTTIGAIAGGTAGGIAGSWGASTLLSTVFEKDAEMMVDILTKQFQIKSEEYVISKEEADSITTKLQASLNDDVLKDMFQSKNRKKFANKLLTPLFEETLKERKKVHLPSFEETRTSLEDQFVDVVYMH